MNDLTPKSRARRIARGLARLYPDARCSLDFADPLQLLIATILAAQCTDARINMISPALFARFPDAASYATAEQAELEKFIRTVTYPHSKARNILLCCRQLVERHGGAVPATMEELVELAGVGRKTANVILGTVFGVPGIPVDTHVTRLSQRMGLTTNTEPVAIERDLMPLVPRRHWVSFGQRMIHHGRQVCHARRPLCEACPLAASCAQAGVGSVALEA